jgi:CRP-like cAMP-binding protein
MFPSPDADLNPLARKLESIVTLGDEEREAVLRLFVTVRTLRADQDIVRDQDRPSQCCLILDGFAFRYKMRSEGKRQILSFHIPGDIPDLQSLHLEVMDHSLGTLTETKVAFIPHDVVRAFVRAHPRLGDIFWRENADRRRHFSGVGDQRRAPRGIRPHSASVLRAVHAAEGRRPPQRRKLRGAHHAGGARRCDRALDRACEPDHAGT